MVLDRIRTIPAWGASLALHLALFALFTGLVVRQATQGEDKPPAVVRLTMLPPAPPRPAETPEPAVEDAEDAPLLIEAPVADHNETANDCDDRTARLAETIGLGGGLGPSGRGGRRYTRSEGGRRGASSARAVEEGLEWLARHQAREGHWGSHQDRCEKDQAPCASIAGNGSRRMAITALALLAFLANGETPATGKASLLGGPHAEGVRRGLEYLLSKQAKSGQFESSYPIDDYYALYEQAIATWTFAEAAAATGDARLKEAATRAVGNLDRRVTMRVDTSVMGFVVMALRSAECAGVVIPPKAKEWGPKYFQLLVEKKGDFAYRIENDMGKAPLSDIGIYASMLYGLQDVNPKVKKAIDTAVGMGPLRSREGGMNLYHQYYWTLSYLHLGGKDWKAWDAQVRDALTGTQERSGCARGSWQPNDERISNRVLSTALAVLTLHVCDEKLLLHKADSASATAERVGAESMALGEVLWEEAVRTCAHVARGLEKGVVTGTTVEDALARVEAFLGWTLGAKPTTEDDRRVLAAWTRDAQEAAAEVVARSGDLDGALARLAGVADPSPGSLVLRATILARQAARQTDPGAADRMRREAIDALARALEAAPSQGGDAYRLLACLAHDLLAPYTVDAPEGSLVALALEQGGLGRETRSALAARRIPEGLAQRLAVARDAVRSARRRHRGLQDLLDEWERGTLLSIAHVALVGGRAEDSAGAVQEAARLCPWRATEREVLSLLGAASLKAAAEGWNTGDRAKAAEHARVGASAYAYLASLDPKEGARLALPIADLYFMAGLHREAAKRYRTALAQVVKEMGDPMPVREKLVASLEEAGDFVGAVGAYNEAHTASPRSLSDHLAAYTSSADRAARDPGSRPEAIARYERAVRFLEGDSTIAERAGKLRRARTRLASIQLDAKRIEGALRTVAALRGAAVPSSEEHVVLRMEALLAKAQGRWPDALRLAREWLSRSGSDQQAGLASRAEGMRLVAEAYEHVGDVKAAEAVRASMRLNGVR